MEAGLYLVGTPIGNLQDITYRAVEVLKTVDFILAEDTRQTRKLTNHYGISTPLKSCHKFNEASRASAVLEAISQGKAVALVTDSGMPAIADPGSRIVAACHEQGLKVFVIPGPSALTSALALSGMGGAAFHFAGFLPHKSGARARLLAELGAYPCPVVLFESPYRFLKLLDEIAAVLGQRQICVAREMTKIHEESLCGTPDAIKTAFAGRAIKGEFVVVIAPQS